VVKQGGGTLSLSGLNTYTGGTTVSAGAVEVTDNANLGAPGGGVVLNGGALRAGGDFTSGRPVTVGAGGGTIDTGTNIMQLQGGIGGAGALTKTGSGTLRLAGNNSLTGATTLAQGEIALSASSLAALSVSAGARLSGTGTIRGNLTNAGTLSPGASPGTLTVAGNFSQGATGVFAVELASATLFDNVVISGTANLGGTLAVSGLGGFVPQPGQTFRILEAAGGVSGTFATLRSPWNQLSPMLRFEALYRANDVRLSLTQLPFAALEGTANQRAVGAGVDGAIARGTIPNLQRALNALPDVARVSEALTELSPERYTRWFDQAVYSAGATVRAIEQRLDQAPREPRGSLWLDVVRRETEYEATEEKTPATGAAGGLLVGADVRAARDVQVGLLFGYTGETLNLDEAGSDTEVARFNVSAYTRFDWAPAFLEMVVGGTYAELESRRTIAIPGYAQKAAMTTKSRERYAGVRAGYTFSLGEKAKLTPYAGLGYVGWATDAANETGAREANLRIAAQSRSSLAARTGLVFAAPFLGEDMSFTPKIDVAWRHEFRDQNGPLAASLGGSRFSLPGEGDGEESLTGGLGEPAGRSDSRKANGFTAGLGLDVTFGAHLNTYLRLATERATAADRALEARAGAELRF
jgi:outer membrane autotransporter protein